jgi:hypothetical protein
MGNTSTRGVHRALGLATSPRRTRCVCSRVAASGRVIVADRENNRLQVFDAGGQYLTSWSDVYHPMDVFVDADDSVYVTDQIPRLSKFGSDGTLLGRCRPVLIGAHGIWIDSRVISTWPRRRRWIDSPSS